MYMCVDFVSYHKGLGDVGLHIEHCSTGFKDISQNSVFGRWLISPSYIA